jgi:beta-lactamase regulating signal transducer with metallopeptidase domain
MTNLLPFIGFFLSIHFLLWLSSFCMGGNWLLQQPSLKLFIARLVFASCVLSPVAVCFVKQHDQPILAKFISLDDLYESSKEAILNQKKEASLVSPSAPISLVSNINYSYLAFIALFLGLVYQSIRFIKDLRKLRLVLRSAFPYRSYRRLSIKVSDRCLIPFSVRSISKAYIILPVSLLNSSQDVNLAIAHEGQHHRQGDCLWAYFMECASILFWGNPGVRRWRGILGELQELTCDEALVGHQMISAHEYGHCLFKVAQTASQYSNTHPRKLACTVGMAWNNGNREKSFITRRICMLSQYQLRASKRSVFGFVLVLSAIVAPLCTAYAVRGALSRAAPQSIDISLIDTRIQEIASTEIAAAVKHYRAKSGAIAVADARTGNIIAFAEAGNIQGEGSWKSRIFAPASTIKPFVVAAALEAGITSESTVYNCHAPYDVGGKKFMNSEENISHATVAESISKSINVCILKLAQDVGSTQFRKTLAGFGFDTNSTWHTNESDALQLANAALGSTIPVNIETITKAYAILANHGYLFGANAGSAISQKNADVVTRMLVDAVKHGTGTHAALPNFQVAGKTGTLEESAQTNQEESTRLQLFAGYVLESSPHFVAFVVMEEGIKTETNEKGSGGSIAAPVFQKVAAKSLEIFAK